MTDDVVALREMLRRVVDGNEQERQATAERQQAAFQTLEDQLASDQRIMREATAAALAAAGVLEMTPGVFYVLQRLTAELGEVIATGLFQDERLQVMKSVHARGQAQVANDHSDRALAVAQRLRDAGAKMEFVARLGQKPAETDE